MSLVQLFALSPFLVLAFVICVLLLVIAFARNFAASATIAATGLILTLASIIWTTGVAPVQVTPLVSIDSYGLFYAFLVTATALGVSLLAYDYFRDREALQDEFYVLLLSATLGGITLAFSTHFASFVLGLELLGVSLYAMISYPRHGLKSVEAALKYLILSGVSSAFILFGAALVFAVTGTLAFTELPAATGSGEHSLLLMAGIGMLLAGVMFKLSLVPFHMWTPDVYEGAPAPVTGIRRDRLQGRDLRRAAAIVRRGRSGRSAGSVVRHRCRRHLVHACWQCAGAAE
ncbi:MAG: proton-conducting transporter membrane subunit [Gammaproteobacteria bacterium]|nr:proton-conducting transporter membrane subunit [Gammaproteobacteria bacterium]